MQVCLAGKGDTITATPHNTRKQFPLFETTEVIDGTTYGVTAGIFKERIPLGSIPESYRVVSITKYQVVFKSIIPITKPSKKRIKKTPVMQTKPVTKLFFFDLETTGVDHAKHGIHQISGSIVIDGVRKETFDFRVQPHPESAIDEEGLKISGTTILQLSTFDSMHNVYNKLMAILNRYVDKFESSDKFFLVGFNNNEFDNAFLRRWFTQNGDKYFGSWFWSSSIDTMVLAAQYLLSHRHKMIDFKLKTVAQALGIVVNHDRLHDAIYDIELTECIYSMVTNSANLCGTSVLKAEIDNKVAKLWDDVLELPEEHQDEAAAAAIAKQGIWYKQLYQIKESLTANY